MVGFVLVNDCCVGLFEVIKNNLKFKVIVL